MDATFLITIIGSLTYYLKISRARTFDNSASIETIAYVHTRAMNFQQTTPSAL